MDSPDSNIRVFFALWPERQQRAELAAWQTGLKPLCGGRVMRPDTLHTTLVFVGEVAAHRLQALQLAAQEVTAAPFELCLELARYWGHNHIVYATPKHAPTELMRLVGDLEQRLLDHHFHFERRPYKPHVTLLRDAHWSDADLPVMPAVCSRFGDFVLVQSLRDERGARYEVLARFLLNRN